MTIPRLSDNVEVRDYTLAVWAHGNDDVNETNDMDNVAYASEPLRVVAAPPFRHATDLLR